MTTVDIQRLREQTGVGMMDAKRALEAAHGDMTAAIEHLRKTGQKIVAAKSARQVKAGAVGVWVAPDHQRGALVALACETDFVARNAAFRDLAAKLATHLGRLKMDTVSASSFLDQTGLDGASSVRESLNAMIATMGENMLIPQVAILSTATGTIDSYLHANSTVAALVALDHSTPEVSHDLTLHVAALDPQFIGPESVPADLVEKERMIYRDQLQREGKPEAMWDKILPGKLHKYYREVCLLDQPFVKDDSLTVRQYLQQHGGATVTGFARITI